MAVAITPAQKYGNDGRNVSCGDAYQYVNNYVMNCNGACQGSSGADDDGNSGGGRNRVCTLQDNGRFFFGDDDRYLRGETAPNLMAVAVALANGGNANSDVNCACQDENGAKYNGSCTCAY